MADTRDTVVLDDSLSLSIDAEEKNLRRALDRLGLRDRDFPRRPTIGDLRAAAYEASAAAARLETIARAAEKMPVKIRLSAEAFAYYQSSSTGEKSVEAIVEDVLEADASAAENNDE